MQDYETALHCAVRQGDLWMTQKLIQTSCAIDAKNKVTTTPLTNYQAAQTSNLLIIAKLFCVLLFSTY